MEDGLGPEDIERAKDAAREDMKKALDEFGRDHPKALEAAAAAVGSTLGCTASFTALYFGGIVTGLSAPGITSALAWAGAAVGGGMAAGVGVLAAPVAILGIAGYALAKRRTNAKLAAALGRAIEKLYNIQERLIANAEHFREELAEINAYIDQFQRQEPYRRRKT